MQVKNFQKLAAKIVSDVDEKYDLKRNGQLAVPQGLVLKKYASRRSSLQIFLMFRIGYLATLHSGNLGGQPIGK